MSRALVSSPVRPYGSIVWAIQPSLRLDDVQS